MALNFKVGHVTTSGTAGVPKAITGVGFTPKALYIYSNDHFNDGYTADDWLTSHGWVTAVGNDRSLRSRFNKASANSNENAAALASGMNARQVLDSFDSDGWTATFTSGTSWEFYYMAFGGSTLSAATASFTIPASGSTSDIAVTGVGFQPDFLLAVDQGDVGGITVDYGFGMASGAAHQACCCQHAGFGTNVADRFETGSLMTQQNASVNPYACALKSFDSDGFTISVSQNSAGQDHVVRVLALKDPNSSFFVGTETQKTSTGTKATTGAGFLPGGAIFAGTKLTGANETTAGNVATQMTWGMTDATLSVTGEVDFKSAATAGAQGRAKEAIVISSSDPDCGSNPAALLAEASLTSFDSDGFTLDWTTADATARRFLYGLFQTGAAVSTKHLLPILGAGQ